MPLLDQFGNPLSVRPVRMKRPKNRGRGRRRVPAQATETARRNLAPVTHVALTLYAKHNLNGVPYGPGNVMVPLDVAQVLREGERNAARTDANFAGTRACVIGPVAVKGALSVNEVAPEYFDAAVERVLPFGAVNRNTGVFQPY